MGPHENLIDIIAWHEIPQLGVHNQGHTFFNHCGSGLLAFASFED
jgi:hypothetical protein